MSFKILLYKIKNDFNQLSSDLKILYASFNLSSAVRNINIAKIHNMKNRHGIKIITINKKINVSERSMSPP